MASQLRIRNPQCIVRYAERLQTRTAIMRRQIRRHYGYKEFSERRGGFALMRFLYARVWVGNERPGVLFDLATAWLTAQESPVARRDHPDSSDLLGARTGRRALLATDKQRGHKCATNRSGGTPGPRWHLSHHESRTPAPRSVACECASPGQALSRLSEVREFDVGPHALGNVPAPRIKALAQYAVTTKAQNIANLTEQRRMATLVSFARQLAVTAQDDALDPRTTIRSSAPSSHHVCCSARRRFSTPLSSTAFVATVIELALIASAPTAGLSRIPSGYSIPAATGMAITL